MSNLPRLALTGSVAAFLLAANISYAQDQAPAPALDDTCCCDPAPAPVNIVEEEDPSAHAAIITGSTFIAVGWAVSATYGALDNSVTNHYLGFVPLAGPLAMATNLNIRDSSSAIGALIFSVWAQAVGVMVLGIGAAKLHHEAPRISVSGGPTSDGAVGSIAVRF